LGGISHRVIGGKIGTVVGILPGHDLIAAHAASLEDRLEFAFLIFDDVEVGRDAQNDLVLGVVVQIKGLDGVLRHHVVEQQRAHAAVLVIGDVLEAFKIPEVHIGIEDIGVVASDKEILFTIAVIVTAGDGVGVSDGHAVMPHHGIHVVVHDFKDHDVAIGIRGQDVRIVVIIQSFDNDGGHEGVANVGGSNVSKGVFGGDGSSRAAFIGLHHLFSRQVFYQEEITSVITAVVGNHSTRDRSFFPDHQVGVLVGLLSLFQEAGISFDV